MYRKLVKQGNGALTITMPYKWLKKNNLKKGDYVDILESEKDLIISTKKKEEIREYTIFISKEKPFFKRYLKSCYILGYDRIIINSDESLPVSEIKTALVDLLGYEILEQTKNHCKIEIIATYPDEDFDVIIKRIFFMINSMFDDIINSLNEEKIEDLKEISLTEESINKFVNFSLRMLNKKGYKDFKKTQYIYQIVTGLEEIGDSLRDFCLIIKKNKKEIYEILVTLKTYFEDIFNLFYKYDMKKIKEIKEKRNKLYHSLYIEIPKYPLQLLHLYTILTILHQLEVALDPINN